MIHFCGSRIDLFTPSEIMSASKNFLASNTPHLVTTLNPEMLVAAQNDARLKKVLGAAALGIIDGFGLLLVLRLKRVSAYRFSGVDYTHALLRMCNASRYSVAFLGGEHVHRAREKFQGEFPDVRMQSFIAPKISYAKGELKGDCQALVDEINACAPQVLLVGLGHGKQEVWIDENLPKMPSVRIAVGVGGTFDMCAGIVPRAPFLMRALGLEWLWRLFLEPRRIKRIFTALFIFPKIALRQKILYDS